MASTTYARIQRVAKKHAAEMCAHAYEIQGEMGVKRCLLGWMAADAGVRLPEERYITHALGMKGTGRFTKEMRSEYGLSLDQLKQLQRANDDLEAPTKLMEVVSRLLETWSADPVPSDANDL